MSALTYLLRSLGLEIVNTLCRTWRAPESPKVVLQSSFWRALGKASIHITPIAGLIIFIWLNYGTLYLGPTITEWGRTDAILLALIQVLAKLLELLCVSSLSTIVLEALRRELLGDGVPIGLLGSGAWFASISSFWSPDFLLAAPWSTTTFRRSQLYGLIVLSGVIAAFIGPSAAVLMLPRYQDMPAGGTSFYLGGTAAHFYPDSITSASELDVCAYANATKYAVCPSGGYASLHSTLATLNSSDFNAMSGFRFSPQIQATGAWGDWYQSDITIESPQSLIPPVLSTFTLRSLGGETVASQPHAATVTVMQQLVRDWANLAGRLTRGSRAEWKWTYDLATSGSAMSPSVRTRCSVPQGLSAAATQAEFPSLHQYSYSEQPSSTFWAGSTTGRIAGLTHNKSAHLRTHWVALPAEDFEDLHVQPTGLLVEMPSANESRVAIACSIAAAWHNSTVSADRSTKYDAWKVDRTVKASAGGWLPQNSPDTDRSNRPVFLDDSWLQLLTPASPSSHSGTKTWKPNTLEGILVDAGYNHMLLDPWTKPQSLWNGTDCYWGTMNDSRTSATKGWTDTLCDTGSMETYLELILALLVADGLSRYGSHRVYDVQPLLQDWALLQPQTFNSSRLMKGLSSSPASLTGFLSRWLTVNVVGYGYYASTTTDYLAIGVVCAYILLASAHLLRTLLSKDHVTSTSFETITELLVLCQNSPPPASDSGIANASGGIRQLGTYSTVVRVRAVKSADGPAEPALQLIVEDKQSKNRPGVERACRDNSACDKAGGAVSAYVKMVQASVIADVTLRIDSRERGLERVEVDVKYA